MEHQLGDFGICDNCGQMIEVVQRRSELAWVHVATELKACPALVAGVGKIATPRYVATR